MTKNSQAEEGVGTQTADREKGGESTLVTGRSRSGRRGRKRRSRRSTRGEGATKPSAGAPRMSPRAAGASPPQSNPPASDASPPQANPPAAGASLQQANPPAVTAAVASLRSPALAELGIIAIHPAPRREAKHDGPRFVLRELFE